MFAKIATKCTAKFSDVIQAIENRDDTKLKQFKEAGILSSKVDPNGHSVLLHYLTRLSDPSIDSAEVALFNSHIVYFAQQCPAEIWEQFKFCALQATKAQNYETLKRLTQSYGTIKSHLQQRQLVELQSLYRDIFSLIVQRKPGDDDINELLADEEVDLAQRSKLESTQVIDSLLEWSHSNAFPWALEQNSKALYLSLECGQRKIFISMNIFEYCYNHFLDHQRQAIVSLYQKLYLTSASMDYCALLTWLNQYETLVDPEYFQILLKSALIKTSGCNTAQIQMLISKINQLDIGLLLDVLVKTINDIRRDIDHKNGCHVDITPKIMNHPELISHEVASIEFLLQSARKNRVFSGVLQSTIETLKKTKGVEKLEENMKLLLVALSLHYTRPTTLAAVTTTNIQGCLLIELTNLDLTDDEGSLLIQQFGQYSHLFAPPPSQVTKSHIAKSDSQTTHGSDVTWRSTSQIRFLLSLSNNSLGYRFASKLSECFNGGHLSLAVLDLSNNPKLGGGTFYSSSGVQVLAKSLEKNSTLQKLTLSECGLNDKDFKTLVSMLTVNSHVIELDLSRNRTITTKEINSKLPNLYKDRYKHHKPAVRLLLEFSVEELNAILKVLGPITLSQKEIFRRVFKRHLMQLKNTTFGIQTKFEDPHSGNLSFLTFAKHALHGIAAIATITGTVGTFVVWPFASIALVHALQESAHYLAEGFEKFALAPQALETIAELYELYGETKEILAEYCHEYGIMNGIPKAIIDLYLHIRRLYTPENQKEIRLLSQKLKVLSIVLSVNRTAANFAHDFSDTFSKLSDPLEVILLANFLDQCFSSFSLDPNTDTNCSTFTDDFSHWLIAKEPDCHEVLKIKKEEISPIVIFTGSTTENQVANNFSISPTMLQERSKAILPYKEVFCDRSLEEQVETEWAINIIRRRGFQCYGTNNCILRFDLEFKKSGETTKESKEWTKTEGERFGYRPIGKEFLRKIKDAFDTYQNATSFSAEPVNNKLTFNKKQNDNILIMLQEEVYIRHTVDPNGDCGYTAFGIDRKQAYQFLYDHIDAIRDIIKTVVEETLLTNEAFVLSLEGYEGAKMVSENYYSALRRQETNLQQYEDALKQQADDLNLISAYIDYDVKDKKIDGGWCHPLILYALAHIRGVHLRLYEIGGDGKMIPHRHHPEYSPPNATDSAQLLFINRNHFERVELRPGVPEKLASSPNGEQSDPEILKKSQKAHPRTFSSHSRVRDYL